MMSMCDHLKKQDFKWWFAHKEGATKRDGGEEWKSKCEIAKDIKKHFNEESNFCTNQRMIGFRKLLRGFSANEWACQGENSMSRVECDRVEERREELRRSMVKRVHNFVTSVKWACEMHHMMQTDKKMITNIIKMTKEELNSGDCIKLCRRAETRSI